jgi:hypothetical protein
MAVITISRGSYHHGREVAETLAAKLGATRWARGMAVRSDRCGHIVKYVLPHPLHGSTCVFYKENCMLPGAREFMRDFLSRNLIPALNLDAERRS